MLSECVIKFKSLSRTEDSNVHLVNISNVIVAYTLESLSSLTWITHNLPAIEKEQQKSESTN